MRPWLFLFFRIWWLTKQTKRCQVSKPVRSGQRILVPALRDPTNANLVSCLNLDPFILYCLLLRDLFAKVKPIILVVYPGPLPKDVPVRMLMSPTPDSPARQAVATEPVNSTGHLTPGSPYLGQFMTSVTYQGHSVSSYNLLVFSYCHQGLLTENFLRPVLFNK